MRDEHKGSAISDAKCASIGPGADTAQAAQRTARNSMAYDALLDDPYPFYKELRQSAPVHYSAGRGAWMISRFDDISRIEASDALSHGARCDALFAGLSEEIRNRLPTVCKVVPNHLGHLDSTAHTKHRKLMQAATARPVITALKPMVEAKCKARLEALNLTQDVDLIGDFAKPLPFEVLVAAMGLDHRWPLEDVEGWTRNMLGDFALATMSTDELDRKERAVGALSSIFGQLLSDNHGTSDSLIIRALKKAMIKQGLGLDAAICTAIQCLTGGYESLRHAVSVGLHTALNHPQWTATQMQSGGLSVEAVDELMRYDCVVQKLSRTVSKPVTLSDVKVPKGANVHLLPGSGNRDPERFANPDTLDLRNGSVAHFAFGAGPHYCPGAGLARMLVQVALTALLNHDIYSYIRTEDAQWDRDERHRGIARWPVQVQQ
ncbi:hypothetical protein CLV80_112116 [Yoonia maritima]|uniref:Cytochrome P450 n=1 Tax=Yoonia maritima TaxID=1435347 RepID=A0A2T0VVJ9_9RHOB|nr:cytochrome P450 [Yoonia maritima]PRY75529.1 hypothetical protein CLV80_112116 [Yoonia maritima]